MARFLRDEYGAHVYGIGSLFDTDRPFGSRSDIDLVVAGLPRADFFAASARAQELTGFNLDIIPLEHANELIRETVQHGGVPL